uniref:IQ motif containing with AAA domain 1 n=1 Tax=Hippocampus comes TaxID=109280 RepID=A0A3Q3E9Z7_HIPCM
MYIDFSFLFLYLGSNYVRSISQSIDHQFINQSIQFLFKILEELPEEPILPQKDRAAFFQTVAMLYVRYLQVFRQLEKVYDQVVHPQKRRLVLHTLEGVMGRILELKNEMVDKELCEYHYMDDVLHDLKLTPADLEIAIPHYFLSERSKDNRERTTMLRNILQTMESTGMQKVSETSYIRDGRVPSMSQDEAIRIIQVAERARQGRLRAALNEASRRLSKIPMAEEPKPSDMDRAAVRIQKFWRGYVERKKAKAVRIEDMTFLGMAPCEAIITADANETAIRNKQREHEDDYQKAVTEIANHLLEVEGQDIANNMKEQIRQWFLECRNLTGVFPDFPDDDEGGSAILFAEKDYEEVRHNFSQKKICTHDVNWLFFRSYWQKWRHWKMMAKIKKERKRRKKTQKSLRGRMG